MVYGIFRQAAQPALAMRLLEDIVAPEALARIARATGRIPSRRSSVALAAPDLAFLSQTAALLDHAVTRPSTPLYPVSPPSCRRCSRQSSQDVSARPPPRSTPRS